jgi:hypothetical protein
MPESRYKVNSFFEEARFQHCSDVRYHSAACSLQRANRSPPRDYRGPPGIAPPIL